MRVTYETIMRVTYEMIGRMTYETTERMTKETIGRVTKNMKTEDKILEHKDGCTVRGGRQVLRK